MQPSRAMDDIRRVAVIDIGKTNAKVALVDMASLAEVSVRTTPNAVLRDGPYPHYDCENLWRFILESIAALHTEGGVDAISVTTHGVAAALLAADGTLAMPVLDYESGAPEAMAADYDAARPSFAETGTPRLPVGLNLGSQLFWQDRAFPGEFAGVATILMYPQYWTWRLTGVAANEVTSLGCHTDLWNPWRGDFSSLVDEMGWRRLMAPVRLASDCLGPVLPLVAERTGLDPKTPVFCGIHDSNASLLPHLLAGTPPFSVVSTGTWVISMAVGGRQVTLDPARDTLVNVNALGDPVPSARFMGGREFSLLTEGNKPDWTEDDAVYVLARKTMLLPSIQQGSGPYPQRKSAWLDAEGLAPGQSFAAISFYLALMTVTSLELIGADGPTIVEGPFARNALFTRMLAAATDRAVQPSEAATGTSIGAALLTAMGGRPGKSRRQIDPPGDTAWAAYAKAWRTAVQEPQV